MAASNVQSVTVLCAGILVADIFVPPMTALPNQGELVATGDFLIDSGGCAPNVATCLSRLGVNASVSGRVGADIFGDFVVNDLQRKAIATSGIIRSTKFGTSKTVILPVVDEDRRFIHTFGANAEYCGEDITISDLAEGDVLYLGGFLVMPALTAAAVADHFERAHRCGIITVLDVVVPAGQGADAMESLAMILPHTDYFLPNSEEAHALTGETDPREQVRRLLAAGCGSAIVTRGESGTHLANDRVHYEVGAFPINYVDGSGAGDAFAAGLITGLIENWELADTLIFASAVGASACTMLGCTPGVFNRPAAEKYILDHKVALHRHR